MALDQDYYEYLLYLMRSDLPEYRNYNCLLEDLYDIEFIYSHPMDENRVMDALYLRKEFLFDHGYDINDRFMDRKVSVLEVLATFSRRIEIEITGEPGDDHIERWFWEMLKNLGVLLEDDIYDRGFVRNKIDIWMTRNYKRNGEGGVFPLKSTSADQRDVDIWYQMQAYLNENWNF